MNTFGGPLQGAVMKLENQGQLERLGISPQDFNRQLRNFETDFPPAPLLAPATVGNGITRMSESRAQELIDLYEHFLPSVDVLKFVPASGAATRMFKAFFADLNALELGEDLSPEVKKFFSEIRQYPFFDDLAISLKEKGLELEQLLDGQDYAIILEEILDKEGLNYGQLPKALVKFHQYDNRSVYPLEEHLKEGVNYGDSDGKVRIHFTLSNNHLDLVSGEVDAIISSLESKAEIDISYSTQSNSTNIVAVYPDNSPVSLKDGSLMFRPGGHGALLKNLNEMDAELIFIKNIDNVCPDRLAESQIRYKKILAGRLMELREEIHSLLNGLNHNGGVNDAKRYIKYNWGVEVEEVDDIKTYLDRPIRVCGMVENTGAPGGGPFWVEGKNGSKSLQIVESSQINLDDPDQRIIFEQATHFNPVDIVCWVRRHNGEKFDLMQFRDDNTGFITEKSFEGQSIKAQELPGLWNGSMAHWITEFVEVPLETFNPVKQVFDLLNEGHRASN